MKAIVIEGGKGPAEALKLGEVGRSESRRRARS